MSKLHVTQIEGYLNAKLKNAIDMTDYQSHSDPEQVKKAFLTRGLAALAAAHLTEAPLQEVAQAITDGPQNGGIDVIYFDQTERTLYLVQSKWHDSGHGSIELGDALKFVDGARRVCSTSHARSLHFAFSNLLAQRLAFLYLYQVSVASKGRITGSHGCDADAFAVCVRNAGKRGGAGGSPHPTYQPWWDGVNCRIKFGRRLDQLRQESYPRKQIEAAKERRHH